MNKSKEFATMLNRALEATVVNKPAVKKKRVYSKILTDKELQKIWNRNRATLATQTATQKALRRPYRLPNPLAPILGLPSGRMKPRGLL